MEEPGEACRNADRSATVAPRGEGHQTARDGRSGATGTASRRAAVLPWVVGGAVEHRAGHVDAAELAGGCLAGQDRAPEVADAFHHHARVRRHLVSERNRGVGVGPTGDLIELLDPDGHATERFGDVGGASGALCLLTR